jgi:hypothetical protein
MATKTNKRYDASLDVGEVRITGEQAKAVLWAVAYTLENANVDQNTLLRLIAASNAILETFRMGVKKPLKPGTKVTWAGKRWTVVEWQPHNGIGGSYWLQNAKGETGVAGPGEVRKVVKR